MRVYVLPAWKGKRIPEIDKGTVRSLIADIAGRAPIMANRVLTQVKTLFNWAVAEDILTASPCAGLKPPAAEVSRDRTLADHELGAVWRACDGLGRSVDWMGNEVTRPYGAIIKLLALTGQRLREVSEMRWSELDLDARLVVTARVLQERACACSSSVRSGASNFARPAFPPTIRGKQKPILPPVRRYPVQDEYVLVSHSRAVGREQCLIETGLPTQLTVQPRG